VHTIVRKLLAAGTRAARTAGDGRTQAGILTYLGNIAYLEDDFVTALALHRDAEALTSSARDRAVRRLLIAKDLAASGSYAEALATAEEVAASSIDSPIVVADAHALIGRTRVATGDYEGAAGHFQQALTVYRSLRLQEEEADALNGLALAAQGSGRMAEAVAHGEAALDRIEGLRVKVSAPELRALYAAAQRSFYETEIDILMSVQPATDERAGRSGRQRARAREDARGPVERGPSRLPRLRRPKGRGGEEPPVRRPRRGYQRDRLLAAPLTAPAKEQLDRVARDDRSKTS
jgi:tetratricopeptide (TPR) repeat protein